MKNIDIFSLTGVISYRKIISYGRFQDTKTKGDNNYFKLFKAIKNGEVKNEEEAQEYLEIANRASFLRFKNRYVKKLLANLENSKRLNYQGALLAHELFELFTKAKTLRDLGDHRNSVVMNKLALAESVKNRFMLKPH